MCVCPPTSAIVEDESASNETVEQEDKPIANPECTTGNASACKDADGEWDPLDCSCSFAVLEEDTTNDNVKEDFLDENIPQEDFDRHMAEDWPILSRDFNMYTRLIKVGTVTFTAFKVMWKIADTIEYWHDDDDEEESGEEDEARLRESDDEEDDEEHYGWSSEFWSDGNYLASVFFSWHWILSELYRRDRAENLFQVYLKYSHVIAGSALMYYAYEIFWWNHSAIIGAPIFFYGYTKYFKLWRSVDKYVQVRQAERYLEEYGISETSTQLDGFETPEDFPETAVL